MTHAAKATHAVAALFVALALAACSQVLGIEEAHRDPKIGLATGGTAGSESGGADVGGTPSEGGAGSPTGGAPSKAGDAGMPGIAGRGGDRAGAGGDPPDAGGDEGTLCEQYCAAVVSGCTGEHAQYIDRDACLAACAYLPPGSAGDKTGNSVGCRLTYAQKASSEPYTYCTWAGPGGDGKCGTNCEGFCSLMMHACTAESTEQTGNYFMSDQACETACAGIGDVGNYSTSNQTQQKGADHVQCRLYHVGAAIAEDDPLTHCQHAVGIHLCVNPPGK